MIPATLAMLVLWWWAARLRRRPGAPRLVRAVPIALIVAVGVGWAATVWTGRRAAEAARQAAPAVQHEVFVEHLQPAVATVTAVSALLAAALVLLVVVAWRTRHERPFASGNITGPR